MRFWWAALPKQIWHSQYSRVPYLVHYLRNILCNVTRKCDIGKRKVLDLLTFTFWITWKRQCGILERNTDQENDNENNLFDYLKKGAVKHLEYNVVQENGNWDMFRPLLCYLALISPFDIYDILDKGKSDPCLLSFWWLTDMATWNIERKCSTGKWIRRPYLRGDKG